MCSLVIFWVHVFATRWRASKRQFWLTAHICQSPKLTDCLLCIYGYITSPRRALVASRVWIKSVVLKCWCDWRQRSYLLKWRFMGPRSRKSNSAGLGKSSKIFIFNEYPTVDQTMRNTEIIDLEDSFHLQLSNIPRLCPLCVWPILGSLSLPWCLPALSDDDAPTGKACQQVICRGQPRERRYWVVWVAVPSLAGTLTSLPLMFRWQVESGISAAFAAMFLSPWMSWCVQPASWTSVPSALTGRAGTPLPGLGEGRPRPGREAALAVFKTHTGSTSAK